MDRSLSPCDQHTKRGLPDKGSILIFGKQSWVNFLGHFGGEKSEKKHPIFGVLPSSHIPLIHFAKKMSQNGQLCPQ